jgi:hypothetical protein
LGGGVGETLYTLRVEGWGKPCTHCGPGEERWGDSVHIGGVGDPVHIDGVKGWGYPLHFGAGGVGRPCTHLRGGGVGAIQGSSAVGIRGDKNCGIGSQEITTISVTSGPHGPDMRYSDSSLFLSPLLPPLFTYFPYFFAIFSSSIYNSFLVYFRFLNLASATSYHFILILKYTVWSSVIKNLPI